jgi:hypothetical protein
MSSARARLFTTRKPQRRRSRASSRNAYAFKAALDEIVIGEPVNRVLEVDLDREEVTLTLYDLPPA